MKNKFSLVNYFSLLFLLLFIGFSSMSCQSGKRQSSRTTLNRVDDAMLFVSIERFLEGAVLASREPGIVLHYAAFLSHWYHSAVLNEDPIAALNLLKRCKEIHFQLGGSRNLWQKVLNTAKKDEFYFDGTAFKAIPKDFK